MSRAGSVFIVLAALGLGEVACFRPVASTRRILSTMPGSAALQKDAVSSKCMMELKMSPHNFGGASSRDSILYTAERPGNPPGKADRIPNKHVKEWISYMKDKGISHVIALLDDNELCNYDEPGLLAMYEQGGMKCYLQPMREDGAADMILGIIGDVEKKNQKIVCHCTGGIGRAGRVAAAWLVHRYNSTPEDATKEVMDHANVLNIKRKGDIEMLEGWLAVE